ncbi:MAG: hypothetical protein AMXMBFR58_29150 [Phycisphaerae bacterium]
MDTGFNAGTFSTLIGQASAGDRTAFDRLFAVFYDELRNLAQGFMRDERTGHTLQTTAVVHEMYGRLADARSLSIDDRRHFFKLAAKVIRQVLLDHAKTRNRDKRGGGADRVTLDTAILASPTGELDIESLHGALEELASLSPRQAQIVEWKFFADMTAEDIASLLGVTSRTVESDWAMAKIWLQRRLGSAGPDA